MKSPRAKVKIRAKCFKCNRTWVMLKVKGNMDKLKDFALPEEIPCIFCGYVNKQSELRLQKNQR